MASTFKIPYLVTAICQSDSLITLLTDQDELLSGSTCSAYLIFHTLLIIVIKFCTYNSTSNFNIYL